MVVDNEDPARTPLGDHSGTHSTFERNARCNRCPASRFARYRAGSTERACSLSHTPEAEPSRLTCWLPRRSRANAIVTNVEFEPIRPLLDTYTNPTCPRVPPGLAQGLLRDTDPLVASAASTRQQFHQPKAVVAPTGFEPVFQP